MKHRLLDALRDLVPTVRSALVGLVTVALAAGTWLLVDRASGSVDEDLRNARRQLTGSIAASVEWATDDLLTSIEIGFSSLEPWNPDARIQATQLDPLLHPSLGLADVVVVRPNGVVDRAAAGSSTPEGVARSGDHLDLGLAGEVAMTGVVRDNDSGLDVLRVAVPIRTAAGAVGAVGVAQVPVSGGPFATLIGSLTPRDAAGLRVGVAVGGEAVLTATGLDRLTDPLSPWGEVVERSPGRDGLLIEHELGNGSTVVTSGIAIDRGWTVLITQQASAFSPGLIARRPAVAAVPGLAALLFVAAAGSVAHRRRVRMLAADADDSKRSFLSVTGHELRTPLTVMGGMLKTMQGAIERGLSNPEMLESMVDAARRNAQLLELRIERILLVAALDSGRGATVQLRELALAPVVGEVAETVAQTSPSHTIEVDLDPELLVAADAKALSQVMLELLTNAVRYTPGGGTIHVAAVRKTRRVEVSVVDSGVGLPSDERRIFEKFRQGEEVDKRVHDEGGVGLGLWIAKTLVTAMDGHIRAERLPDGTKVVFDLPVA